VKTKDTGLRELPSFIFAEHRLPDEFRLFVKHRILPDLNLTGYKIDRRNFSPPRSFTIWWRLV